MRHVPVLVNEVIESLALAPGMTVVDCTLGDAGHAERMLAAIGPTGRLVGFDADPESLARSQTYLQPYEAQTTLVRENFLRLGDVLREHGISAVDAVLFDLGWSSPQFAERGRGFSFAHPNEPLDMRYSGNLTATDDGRVLPTAAELVNNLEEKELINIFRQYGEEQHSHEIVRAIILARKQAPIRTVGDLVSIILTVYRQILHSKNEIPWIGGLHPATRVFQALRIMVNEELEVLRQALPQAVDALRPGGRLAVITFHSVEDSIVKHYFKSIIGKKIQLVNKKPIECSPEEYKQNPPSRSAKLRVVEHM